VAAHPTTGLLRLAQSHVEANRLADLCL